MSKGSASFFLLVALAVLVVGGCGGQKEPAAPPSQSGATTVASGATAKPDTAGASPAATSKLSTDELAIQDALNEAQIRLHYGDKSGLYENEFEYLTDETDFDKYLDMPQIKNARADSLEYIEVKGVEPREYNSVMVDLVVHFLGSTGVRHGLPDRVRMFKHKGRWIKPTVSRADHQLDYEKIIRQADSAAAAEAGTK